MNGEKIFLLDLYMIERIAQNCTRCHGWTWKTSWLFVQFLYKEQVSWTQCRVWPGIKSAPDYGVLIQGRQY